VGIARSIQKGPTESLSFSASVSLLKNLNNQSLSENLTCTQAVSGIACRPAGVTETYVGKDSVVLNSGRLFLVNVAETTTVADALNTVFCGAIPEN